IFDTGFLGVFSRTIYPSSLITLVNKFWANQADLLYERMKLDLIASEFSRRTYSGRVYAKAQNCRPYFIRAYDSVLADLDLLVMPTCSITAPKYEAPTLEERFGDRYDAIYPAFSRNTRPFNFTGHPAVAVPVGKADGLPVSMQLVGRFFEEALLLRAAYAYE